MKILVSGGTGFLGSCIIKELKKTNTVFCLSRTNGDYKIALENSIPNFEVSFELIIHAAGKAHKIPKTDLQKKEFNDVNVVGTLNLLRGLEKSGIPKEFVFISSVSVYGQENGLNIKEDDALCAKDPYGVSKIEAEKLVQKWCNNNKVICTILRLPLLVGKNPPGNLGAMLNAIKSMVLVRDVASFIPIVAPVGGIYNLTDGFHPSFLELSTAISKQKNIFNLPIFLAKILAKAGDLLGEKSPINSIKLKKITSELTFDDSKARKLLNWNPDQVLDYLKRESL